MIDNGYTYDTEEACTVCGWPIRRGAVETDAPVDGNGDPKDDTREWRHAGFDFVLHARGTTSAEGMARMFHQEYDAINPKSDVQTATVSPVVNVPAADWLRIEALILAADRVAAQSTKCDATGYYTDQRHMNALDVAIHLLPEQYRQDSLKMDAGAPVVAETATEAPVAVEADSGSQDE